MHDEESCRNGGRADGLESRCEEKIRARQIAPPGPLANGKRGQTPASLCILYKCTLVAITIRMFDCCYHHFWQRSEQAAAQRGMKWTSLSWLTRSRTPPVAISPSMETAIDGGCPHREVTAGRFLETVGQMQDQLAIDLPGTSTRSDATSKFA